MVIVVDGLYRFCLCFNVGNIKSLVKVVVAKMLVFDHLKK